jgi:hypothetical protein
MQWLWPKSSANCAHWVLHVTTSAVGEGLLLWRAALERKTFRSAAPGSRVAHARGAAQIEPSEEFFERERDRVDFGGDHQVHSSAAACLIRPTKFLHEGHWAASSRWTGSSSRAQADLVHRVAEPLNYAGGRVRRPEQRHRTSVTSRSDTLRILELIAGIKRSTQPRPAHRPAAERLYHRRPLRLRDRDVDDLLDPAGFAVCGFTSGVAGAFSLELFALCFLACLAFRLLRFGQLALDLLTTTAFNKLDGRVDQPAIGSLKLSKVRTSREDSLLGDPRSALARMRSPFR